MWNKIFHLAPSLVFSREVRNYNTPSKQCCQSPCRFHTYASCNALTLCRQSIVCFHISTIPKRPQVRLLNAAVTFIEWITILNSASLATSWTEALYGPRIQREPGYVPIALLKFSIANRLNFCWNVCGSSVHRYELLTCKYFNRLVMNCICFAFIASGHIPFIFTAIISPACMIGEEIWGRNVTPYKKQG